MRPRAHAEPRSEESVERHIDRDRRPLRVLVVENDVDTRTFFTLFLQQLGHEAHAASGVGEALSKLRDSSYDVMFADIGLADGSGWDLMRRVKEGDIPSPPYAVAMTGYGLADDRARSEAAGFRRHLLKPFETAALRAVLDEASREIAASR